MNDFFKKFSDLLEGKSNPVVFKKGDKVTRKEIAGHSHGGGFDERSPRTGVVTAVRGSGEDQVVSVQWDGAKNSVDLVPNKYSSDRITKV